jgi:hypothetical protein
MRAEVQSTEIGEAMGAQAQSQAQGHVHHLTETDNKKVSAERTKDCTNVSTIIAGLGNRTGFTELHRMFIWSVDWDINYFAHLVIFISV